jgi:siroheme synthase
MNALLRRPLEVVPVSSSAAGPGGYALVAVDPDDPDALTLAALRRLRSAEIVVTERRLEPILASVRREEAGAAVAAVPEFTELEALVVHHLASGRRVVRLTDSARVDADDTQLAARLADHGWPVDVVLGARSGEPGGPSPRLSPEG